MAMKHNQKNTHTYQPIQTAIKSLVIAVSSLMVVSIGQASVDTTKKIGDLEIYQSASNGKTNLMMMLDTSGSMGISSLVLPKNNLYGSPGDVDTALCSKAAGADGVYEWQYNAIDTRTSQPSTNKNTFYKSVTVNGETVPYYLRGCKATGSTTPSIDTTGNLVESETGKFDRLSRLKDALIQLLAGTRLSDNISMGLGNFSSKTPILIGNSTNKLVDGHSGTILVPAAPLTQAQRLKLIKAIAAFKSVDTFTNEDGTANAALASNSSSYPDIYKSSSGTPTAHAYAEAGAYMMGTNTGIRTTPLPTNLNLLYDGAAVMQKNDSTEQVYYVCINLGTASDASAFGATIKQCDNAWNSNETNPLNNQAYGTWYDSANQKMGSNIAIYKPNGTGGWTQVTPDQLKNEVGAMTTAWETHSKLPVGWRYGGWMKVDNNPMDIEPINTKGWGNSGGATAYISYRSNPFSIESEIQSFNKTERKLVYQDCPSGFFVESGWPSLCYQPRQYRNQWVRDAKYDRNRGYYCDNSVSPNVGADPITNVYHFASDYTYPKDPADIRTDRANTNPNNWELSGAYCFQKKHYVARGVEYKTITTSSNTLVPINNIIGGFAYSASDTKSGNNYIRGATNTTSSTAECDANGIYFLTDGAPNSTKDDMAKTIINKSLNDDATYTITSKPTGLTSPTILSNLFPGETGGWEWIGEYAKRLYNKDTNPANISIRTAIAGFGSSFAGLTYNATTNRYDCNTAGATQDAMNACKWGQSVLDDETTTTIKEDQVNGYGNGGFFYTQSSGDIANSVVSFIKSLDNPVPAVPSGTMTIPNDPYKAIGEMPVAYVPTLLAQLSGSTNTSNIWPGNVKKYNLLDGTLVGKSDNKLFSSIKGDLNPATEDLWSATYSGTTTNPSNDSVQAGGVYSNLKAPSATSVNNTRKIFVEDLTAVGATTTELHALSVNTDKKPVGFDTLKDTTTYNRANQIKLLKFMGYERANDGTSEKSLDEIASGTQLIQDLVLVPPTKPVKVLGASVHSKPVAVSYGANLDTTTGAIVQSSRDDYVLFGSMDGALHLVDADDYGTNSGGTEQWAIIPRTMMTSQSDAIVPNANNRPAGVPNFGIDGHWAVDTRYKYDYTTNKVAPDNSVGMSAYGGLRLGGNGLYGLNIATKDTPAIKFFAKPSRMGQIWNRPTFAKIKTSSTDTTGKRVVIVGGGYDTCYEDEAYQVGAASTSTLKNQNDESCATNTAALGNAIYVLDASDGTVLWSVSSSGGTKTHSNMVNSIVASVTALDRDNDGFTDQLYAADLGGQLFRVDFKGGVASASTSRVQRILKDEANDNVATKKYVRRFYEQPVVSFYRDNNSKLFAMINVISGDRSSPLSKLRSDNGTDGANADRIYGIIDRDVTRDDASYYGSNNTLSDTTFKDISATSLINVPKQLGTTPQANKTVIINAINTGTIGTGTNARSIYGWYYPLTRFEGYNNVKYTKGIGRSEVIGGLLYTTVFNPDMKYGEDDPCKASIKGGSERQLYCLPYGVCNDAASTNGTGGFMRAGQGIQELALGPRSGLQPNQRLLIGTTTMAEASDPSNRVNFGQDTGKGDGTTNLFAKAQGLTTTDQGGGDGSMAGYIFNERYTLTPNKWYEQTK